MTNGGLGRRLRSRRPTARLLTEYWGRKLPQLEANADLRACLQYATRGSVAIDVGASVGNYAAAISRRVGPTGQVLALEPNPDVYAELVRSTWGTNVVALNLAASVEAGVATLAVPTSGVDHHAPLGTLQPLTGEAATYAVRCVPLDHLVEQHRPVSLIKIDVEGHERAVVAGARETIERHAPALVVEIEARHTSPEMVVRTAEELIDLGYTCTPLSGFGTMRWEDFDVDANQSSHLSTDGATILEGHEQRYVNNFLFTPKRS